MTYVQMGESSESGNMAFHPGSEFLEATEQMKVVGNRNQQRNISKQKHTKRQVFDSNFISIFLESLEKR